MSVFMTVANNFYTFGIHIFRNSCWTLKLHMFGNYTIQAKGCDFERIIVPTMKALTAELNKLKRKHHAEMSG